MSDTVIVICYLSEKEQSRIEVLTIVHKMSYYLPSSLLLLLYLDIERICKDYFLEQKTNFGKRKKKKKVKKQKKKHQI